MDFTINTYISLISKMIGIRANFLTFFNYLKSNESVFSSNQKIILLRHDVDRNPDNSLDTAKIENELGIKGTYYFRIVEKSYNSFIINQIAKLGHEIGYHYEDVDLVIKGQKSKVISHNGAVDEEKLIDLSYESFCKNLDILRKNFEIKTICMHGSPLSIYDNKIIWKKYNYKDLGLIGEPYFDIDWNEFGYLTDTGRRWNAVNSSVRDKVNSKFNINFKTTQGIIRNIESLPNKLMITIHPQRWNNNLILWTREFVSQSLKNVIKKHFLVPK